MSTFSENESVVETEDSGHKSDTAVDHFNPNKWWVKLVKASNFKKWKSIIQQYLCLSVGRFPKGVLRGGL